ncbi:MAG: FAD-linked oxidoreductase [Caulobacter sp.]|jgi:FAD-linked oxidoreductase|nr:FAD-linked oxidoreductase [Caulobacter sp.]
MAGWSNWSGSVTAIPARTAAPATIDELRALVRDAATVRVVGAGHSFTPLCSTDGLLISLAQLEGELEIAPDHRTAAVPAGWSLRRLTAALWDAGLQLPNQGDVDPQALAGAIATGTHGTGQALGSLSTIARAFRLVTADGALVDCGPSQRPDLFEAQRLSLGLLGVATHIVIDVLPAYRLEERMEKRPLAEVLETFDAIAAAHRHAEFFVFPYSDEAILKTLHPTDSPDENLDGEEDDTAFGAAMEMCVADPAIIPAIQQRIMQAVGPSRRAGPAHRIFPSARETRFEEMEYELPRAAGLPALKAAIDWIRAGDHPVAFPLEFRWTAGDDIWLSPFNGGDGASISLHQYAGLPWRQLFADIEPVFRDHGGRPHWAKRHGLTRADVDALYPMAERFREVRRAVDPEGKFLNRHLTELFA